ncbi:MAG: zf-HC2 domain-containing protein [Kineosporiaceae bacterium]
MSGNGHPRGDLAALALGLLDGAEAERLRTHLAGCPDCRGELVELRDSALLAAALDPADLAADLPADPAPDPIGRSAAAPAGELLLARTLREIRAERASARRRTRASLVAVAAAAVLLGGAGAAGLGLATGQDAPAPPVAQPSSGPAAVQLAGTSASGAAAEVSVEPARDWVRLAVRVTGVPAGERCRVVVVTAAGERVIAGSWTVGEPPEPGTTRPPVLMSAAVPLEEVVSVDVETLAGEPVVSAPA